MKYMLKSLSWVNIMKKHINPQAVARSLLVNYENQPRLSKAEIERVQLALKYSGVNDAANRIGATFARMVLKEVV